MRILKHDVKTPDYLSQEARVLMLLSRYSGLDFESLRFDLLTPTAWVKLPGFLTPGRFFSERRAGWLIRHAMRFYRLVSA